jgi:TPR repeat protein
MMMKLISRVWIGVLLSALSLSAEEISVAELFAKAKDGCAEAQYQVGCMYNDGDQVRQSTAKAVSWISKAADQRHPKALFFLAMCYDAGWEVRQDSTLAQKLLSHAAGAGHQQAQAVLAAESRSYRNQQQLAGAQ